MKLSIIIISYNTPDLTLQALETVKTDLDRSPALRNSTEIIVVDNNSSDNSTQLIKEFKHRTSNLDIHLIENKENLGFGRANNQAIEKSQGKYVLLLNSDTIIQPGALQVLVNTLEEDSNRLGIVAAQLRNSDGSVQPQGGSFPNLLSLTTHMLMLDDIPLIGKFLPSTQHTGRRKPNIENLKNISNFDVRASSLIMMDWVGGTAMLIRKEVFNEIGVLDEQIFMYGEDVELCIRAKNHQWLVGIQPKAQVIHLGSASSSSKNAILGELKGYLYIWSKHRPLWQIPLVRFLLNVGCRLRILLFGTIIKDSKRALIYREALREI